MTNPNNDAIMQNLRKERLKRLCAFMLDERLAPLNMGVDATHNLLTGWFENSFWRTAWYCVKRATDNSWMHAQSIISFWYWRRILRLSDEEIEQRICKEAYE